MSNKVAIIGLGVQGKKRLAIAGSEVVATVDPQNPAADYKDIRQVPLDAFDSAIVCTPDSAKFAILSYLLSNKKHLMVEKPLLAATDKELEELRTISETNRATCYTAYNHRFEPHLNEAAQIIHGGSLGKIYRLSMLYGNGTARDVRNSEWRDKGMGALSDLGSHLIDLVHFFLGGSFSDGAELTTKTFENQAPDFFSIHGDVNDTLVSLEGTMLSWRNTFRLDVLAENGSLHVDCLCKWGPSTLTTRKRILPSGKPPEQAKVLTEPDPTWNIEYHHFKKLMREGSSNINNDMQINRLLNRLWNGKH